MIVFDRVLCSDGIVRFPRRIVRTPRKVHTETEVDARLEKFEELYGRMSEEYYGFKMSFHSRGFKSGVKQRFVEKILEMLKDHAVDLEIFLRGQFEAAKTYPKAIWPSHMASQNALKTYSNFIKKFPDKKSILEGFQCKSLEQTLADSHKKLQFYREKLRLPVATILRTRWSEFNPLYLLSIPEVLDGLNKSPETLDSRCLGVLEEAYKMLQENPVKADRFWKLIRRVKCLKNPI
jgi:hypothetical protein